MHSHLGYCPVCESNTTFTITKPYWLRDFYLCDRCNSIPRYRAIWKIIEWLCPDLTKMKVHESSPGGAVSDKLSRICGPNITFSNFFLDLKSGEYNKEGVRCENLERMTFDDGSFDLLITQDVMEHVYNPKDAFQEIGRVLRPGGMHIFTVPLSGGDKTTNRVLFKGSEMIHLLPPYYHENPIDPDGGSLVINDWGTDISDYIYRYSNMKTGIYTIKDKYFGIDGDFLEVIVSRKR